MSKEHIGRLEKIGLGKESTPGTSVGADVWIPKAEGKFEPQSEKAEDNSAYGNIAAKSDSATVKQMTEIPLNGVLRDIYTGHFLQAALGSNTQTDKFELSNTSGTPFTEGETVTGGTSSATATVVRSIGDGYVLVNNISGGPFQDGETITGGSSGATADISIESTTKAYLFEVANSNNHPSYTVHGIDEVSKKKSTYAMLDELQIDIPVGEYVSFSSTWRGTKEESSTETASYNTEENKFLAAHADLYLATDLSGLDAATAERVDQVTITISKNLQEYQSFDSDKDIDSFHNKQFHVSGEITAIFDREDLKDLQLNSNKRAMRLELKNTDVSLGSANPELVFELPKASFEGWTKESSNDDLVKQTIGFEKEFDVGEGEGIVAYLRNDDTSDPY